MKKLTKKRIALYIPTVLILLFSFWFISQKLIWNARYSTSKYLNEISSQGDYNIVRISTKNEAFGIPFPDSILKPSETRSSVYLDPNKHSLWLNFEGTYNDHSDSTNQTHPSYWVNYNLKGEKIKSLTSDETPPLNGTFLENKFWGFDFDIHNPKNTLHARSFKYESFNWSKLNIASYYGISSSVMGVKGFWEGHVLMQITMPSETINFKIQTNTASRGYTFKCNYYELPKSLSSDEVFLLHLKRTYFTDDEGWYLIYKNNQQ